MIATIQSEVMPQTQLELQGLLYYIYVESAVILYTHGST